MTHAHNAMPEPKAILRAWVPFKKAVGITAVRTKAEYRRALAIIDNLIDEIGDDEGHPLADVLDYLSEQVRTYEDEHIAIPEAEPREVLRFLMERHGLAQSDLSDCAPQGRISDILHGRREVSKEIAKKLALRFGVRADVFL